MTINYINIILTACMVMLLCSSPDVNVAEASVTL